MNPVLSVAKILLQLNQVLDVPVVPVLGALPNAVKSKHAKRKAITMLNRIRQMFVVTMALALTLGLVLPANAQAAPLNANTTVAISLNVTVNESLTISATPASITFTGSTGTVTASAPISITTAWVLASTRVNVKLYAYFQNTIALTGPSGANIQASNVFGSFDSGAAVACNQTGAFTTFDCLGGLTLANPSLPASRWPVGNQTDTLALSMNLGSSPSVGAYTGTLNLTAIAN